MESASRKAVLEGRGLVPSTRRRNPEGVVRSDRDRAVLRVDERQDGAIGHGYAADAALEGEAGHDSHSNTKPMTTSR